MVPQLSEKSSPYRVTELDPEDPGLASQMEDGSEISRARFTRSRLSFTVKSANMWVGDLEAFLEWYRNEIKGKSTSFLWTNPDNNSPYYNHEFTVRMISLINPKKVSFDYWTVEFVLREA